MTRVAFNKCRLCPINCRAHTGVCVHKADSFTWIWRYQDFTIDFHEKWCLRFCSDQRFKSRRVLSKTLKGRTLDSHGPELRLLHIRLVQIWWFLVIWKLLYIYTYIIDIIHIYIWLYTIYMQSASASIQLIERSISKWPEKQWQLTPEAQTALQAMKQQRRQIAREAPCTLYVVIQMPGCDWAELVWKR